MKKGFISGILIALTTSLLVFGCGNRPGEKLYKQAMSQWKQGNHVRARTLLKKSISRRAGSPANAEAYNHLGVMLWKMGDVDEAVDAFNESLRIDSNNYAALCNLGVALTTRDLDTAEQTFRAALLLRPDDPRPLAYTGIVYAQNKKWKDAERNLERALAQNPDDLQLQTAMALTELHIRGAEPALARFRSILNKNPEFEPALFNTAAIYRFWMGDQGKAKVWFGRYLKASSGIDAFSIIARAQLQALSESSAMPSLSLRKPETRDRKKAELHFKEGLEKHRAGRTSEAIKNYIRSAEADDSFDRAFYNLGLAYYTSGKMELAGESFEQAMTLNPAFVDARYNLALVCHYHLGNTSKALRLLDIVLSQQPGYQPAMDLLDRIKRP